MSDADAWVGLVDPKAALAAVRAARRALADFSRVPPDACESVSSTNTETCADFSSFSRSPHSLKQSSGNSAKDRKETCSSSLSMAYEHSASPVGLLVPGCECVYERPPTKAAKLLNHGSTLSDRSTIALADACESFAVVNTVPSPTAHLSGPRGWRDGLARLDRWAPPCPGFRFGEWDALHRVISHFMDHAADEAAARGWTSRDLFGVHRAVGAAAVDSCGALMLPCASMVTSITGVTIAFGPLVYRRRAMPEAVLVWDFAAGGWQEGGAA